MIRRPRRSPLFPYTTLFRSSSMNPLTSMASIPSAARALAASQLSASEDRKSTRLNSTHRYISYSLFFFNDTAPTEISPLSLHDALPIFLHEPAHLDGVNPFRGQGLGSLTALGKRRSEEHTSELHSPLHLLFPLFF